MSTAPPACGWLRGTPRTSPGPPRRWRRPVRLRSTSARGRGFAAYLSACGGQPLQRPRCGLRQGGASLTTFGFVTTVPRYLLEASNLLTFVRGACRAYCAPRKCHCDLIFVRRVSAIAALFMRRARVMLTDRCFACTGCTHAPRRALAGALGSGTLPHALIVHHESGYGDRPSPACASRRATPKGVERALGSGTLPPHAPPGGALAGALGSGTLPHALIVRHESGYGDRPSPACASRRATPKGVERAPDSGTLPPAAVLCRRTYARTSEIPVFPPKTNCILQSPVYINNSVVTGRSPANSVNRKSSKSL